MYIAPADAQPGTYEHTVNATATAGIPFPPSIIKEGIETELIPEFSTIASPCQ